jgi:histidinol-phosphatase
VIEIERHLSFARTLALAAENSILRLYQNCSVNIKSDGSEVTEADHEAERIMREMIKRVYPAHDILGEEFGGDERTSNECCWVLDPIDGTASFALGLPTFGTLVALCINGEPVVGVINFPAMGEMVYAAKGKGCWFESRTATATRLHVGVPVRLSKAMISVSGIHNSDLVSEKAPYALTPLILQTKKLRFISDCVQHALVCQGRLHAAIDTKMHPWDIAALVPCVEESGGVASSLSGQRDGIVFAGSLLTSCDRVLHDQIIELL